MSTQNIRLIPDTGNPGTDLILVIPTQASSHHRDLGSFHQPQRELQPWLHHGRLPGLGSDSGGGGKGEWESHQRFLLPASSEVVVVVKICC